MLKNISIKSRLIFLISALSLLLVGVGVFGLRGMATSNESLRTVYEDRLVALSQLSSIRFRLGQVNSLVNSTLAGVTAQTGEKNAVIYKFNPAQVAKLEDVSKKTIEANNKLWAAYTSTYTTPDEKTLSDDFASKRSQYLNEGLQPVLSAIAAGNHAEAVRLANDKMSPLFEDAGAGIEKLKQLQMDVAKSEYDNSVNNYTTVRNISTASIVIGVLLALGVGLLTMRAILNPLGRILGYFENIGRGNLKNDIFIDTGDEMGKVLGALKTVQSSLQDAKVTAYDYQGQIEAIGKSQGVIEFNMDGTVITANPAFLSVINYTLDEARGKHHSTFVDPVYGASAEYRAFWEKLNRGEFDSGEYKRIAKGGKEIWIQASYNPILDINGKPYKVVKYATEVTEAKLRNANYQGQLEAIGKSQGVIEFNMDGTVITANPAFLAVINYTLDEARGKHHSSFVDPVYGASAEYRAFWEKLNRGEFDSGEYKRIAKGGKEIWIQASYNPILDLNGKPYKVVKYATEVTEAKLRNANYQGQLEAIGKSQGVIEFNLDGTIITANPNFLAVINYTLDEIKGKHHSTLVDPVHAASAEYRAFWEKLNRGEFDSGEYKRVAKGGKEIWIQASYNPISDLNGKPYKVVKYATEVTEVKLRNANYQGQLEAISKSMGTIELNLDGTVITANDIFLNLLGYTLDEARGKHHSTFVDPVYGASEEYRAFWAKLNRGEFDNGEYKRVGKGGKEVWIQASYNPIRDLNGKPYKVVKYASDITTQKHYQMAVEGVLRETKNVMTALADGDLTHTMEGHFEGEFGILRDAVVQSMTNLRDIVQQITEAVNLIGSASKEIAAGNTDLSSRTEEQAASLEETASSMEELSSTVKQNAENAKQANQLAAVASDVAVRGGEVVNDVVHTMSAINDSSRKIVDIISVIDGIAFQTNILALNAAVEAARAGEQGRGFAVVASEVRNLAQRSAAAAKEIKQLISDSVEKVEGGTKLVEQAGQTMEEIVSSVKRVTDIMGEIASASAEQSSGIDQVNLAITQMDEVTQQNAALVEQAAAAATSLEEQAQGLSQSVSVFKLDNQEGVRKISSTPNVVVLAAPKAAPAAPAERNAPKRAVTASKSVKRKSNSDDWEEF